MPRSHQSAGIPPHACAAVGTNPDAKRGFRGLKAVTVTPMLLTVTVPPRCRAVRVAGARVRAVAAGLAAAGLAGVVAAAPAAAEPVRSPAASGALSVAASPGTASYGAPVTLTGTLTDPAGAPLADQPVTAEARTADGGWQPVAGPAPTDATGAVALTIQPEASTVVRLRHDVPDGVASPQLTVPVRAALAAAWDRPGVRVGGSVVLRGTSAPAPAEVRLQRRSGDRWRLVRMVRVGTDGTWSLRVAGEAPGVARYRVVRPAQPGLGAAMVTPPALDVFRLHRYSVTSRGRVTASLARFRDAVAAAYDDPRGWRRGYHRFREVPRGGAFTVVLAQAATVPGFHPVCSATYSCRVGRYVVINETRWKRGSPYFPGDLRTYRQMVVNHETGHWLGRGHASCPARGRPAPVMQQQSKGMQGCRPNPWPLDREIRAVR